MEKGNKIFKEIVLLLKSNLSVQFAGELLGLLNGDEIIINIETVVDKDDAIKVYTDRYNIQKDILKTKFTEGYKNLLDNMNSIDGNPKLNIMKVVTKRATFIVFKTLNKERLIGILRNEKNTIESKKNYILSLENYMYPISYEYFLYKKGNCKEIISNNNSSKVC